MKTLNSPNWGNINRSLLIAAINSNGYQTENHYNPCITEADKIAFISAVFDSEQSHNLRRYPMAKVCENWLRGLPSAINIEYTDHAIYKLNLKWGSLTSDSTDREIENQVNNYWKYLGKTLAQLIIKNR